MQQMTREADDGCFAERGSLYDGPDANGDQDHPSRACGARS
jgi:hypothetical protein